jgi:hypothetical protein
VVKVYPELLNVAVQPMIPVIVTVPVAVQLPDQPANVEPEPGVAVNATEVPLFSVVEHVVPQLIPAGLLVTVPVPVPARVTVSMYVLIRLNTAVQVMLEFIVTLPLAQAVPDHPAKVLPALGVAVRFTTVPLV